MVKTTNYNLLLPSPTGDEDVHQSLADNFFEIDKQMKSNADTATSVKNEVTAARQTPDGTAQSDLKAALNWYYEEAKRETMSVAVDPIVGTSPSGKKFEITFEDDGDILVNETTKPARSLVGVAQDGTTRYAITFEDDGDIVSNLTTAPATQLVGASTGGKAFEITFENDGDILVNESTKPLYVSISDEVVAARTDVDNVTSNTVKARLDSMQNTVKSNTNQIVVLEKMQATTLSFPRLSGETDDTERHKRMVAYAKQNGFRKITITAGTYVVSETIHGSLENDSLAIKFEAENPDTVTYIAMLTGTTPLFSFKKTSNMVLGWSDRWSNGGVDGIRIIAGYVGQGTGIYVSGGIFNQFNNVRMTDLNYGIHLHNDKKGIYTEMNKFTRMRIDFCNTAILLERNEVLDGGGNVIESDSGTGDQSFRGNEFDARINVKPNQKGFVIKKGCVLYDSNIRLYMWGQHKGFDGDGNPIQPTGNERPVYIECNGTVKTTDGAVYVESYGESVVTGSGSFLFDGKMKGIAGNNQPKVIVDDTSIQSDGHVVFQPENKFYHVEKRAISANAGVNQPITALKGLNDPSQPFRVFLRAYGTSVDVRREYECLANGDGVSNGFWFLKREYLNVSTASAFVSSTPWVDINGKFAVNVQTDVPLTWVLRVESLGTSVGNW